MKRGIKPRWHFIRNPQFVAEVLMFTSPERGFRLQCPIERCNAKRSERRWCDSLRLAHDFSGLGLYCSHPSGWTCPHNGGAWQPGVPLAFDAEQVSVFEHSPTRARIRHFLLAVMFDLTADESVGAIAKAWLTDDWHEVDASRPRGRTVTDHREAEQSRLYDALASEAFRRYRDDRPMGERA